MNDKQRDRLAKAKASLKASGMTVSAKHVRVKCNVCEKVWPVRTTMPEIYTESVRNRWICPLCKTEEGDMAQTKEERNAKARARYAAKQVVKPEPRVVAKVEARLKKAGISRPRVAETWIKVLSECVGKKVPDHDIVVCMNTRTGRPGYTESDVARHRSLYNLGKIKGQLAAPEQKLQRFEA